MCYVKKLSQDRLLYNYNMKLSVVIPIYNAERYIEDCIISLFGQTLQNIEYIFVNDSSSDNSIEILKAQLENYPHRKEQTIIINNHTNMGPSGSRNKGLDLCSGDYVAFCDADDYISKDAYQEMLDLAVSKQADIISCGVLLDDHGEELELLYRDDFVYSLSKQISFTELEGVLYSSLWNRIINVDFIRRNNIRFNESLRMWDDLYVSFQLRYFCKSHVILNRPLYRYNRNSTSITSENARVKYLSQIRCAKLIEQFLLDKKDKSYNRVLSFIKFHSKDLMLEMGDVRQWRSTFSETHKNILSFIGFYGPIRIIRYCVVIVGGHVGWKLLSLYSHIKHNLKKEW